MSLGRNRGGPSSVYAMLSVPSASLAITGTVVGAGANVAAIAAGATVGAVDCAAGSEAGAVLPALATAGSGWD